MSLTARQCKAARALLNWSQHDLAAFSRVSSSTLANFEAEKRTPYDRTLVDIERVLKQAGVEIISEPGREGVVRDTSVEWNKSWAD